MRQQPIQDRNPLPKVEPRFGALSLLSVAYQLTGLASMTLGVLGAVIVGLDTANLFTMFLLIGAALLIGLTFFGLSDFLRLQLAKEEALRINNKLMMELLKRRKSEV